jgi:hypothetical protein
VHRSIDQGSAPDGLPPLDPAAAARPAIVVGGAVVLVLLVLYVLTRPAGEILYTHFVWQAQAWLEGQANIRWPVAPTATSPGNDYFHDVAAVVDASGAQTGRALIPFPPLPAVVLLPLVAIFGLATDESLVGAFIGAIDVALAFWLLGRLPIRPSVRLGMTIFLGAGTALWYSASEGSTWFFAHVVALLPALLAVGVALDADAAERDRTNGARRGLIDGRQLLAGFLVGLGATARLTTIFGLPFLFFVGGGGGRLRRSVSAIIGAAIPVLALLAYTRLTTGQLFNPAYEILYRSEVVDLPDLGYHADWAIEDIRYLPQNLAIMLAAFPFVLPECPPGVPREVFSAASCGFLVPREVGTSLILTSPAWLLALPALRVIRRDRIVAGAALATLAIGVVNLMHFSQGWVQFGYRFSLDFAPFLIILAALGAERFVAHGAEVGRRRRATVAVALVVASVAVQALGVAWARTVGW